MTTSEWLEALVPLVADLPQELPEAERYRRLLATLRQLFPCDAVVLLRLDGDGLVPLAVDGLTRDALGRRFRVDEHPRLQALLGAAQPLRFPADSPLPDPYDGLVEGRDLSVHDCMGCVLQVEGRAWGLLTLDALEAGSFDDTHLPILDAFGKLAAATVGAALRINRLARLAESEHLRAEHYKRAATEPERQLQGQSAALRALRREIDVVAGSDLTVLITGETGVGKELVAKAIHAQSRRADLPLVSLNCAALPDTLVESELFGHVKGAFTGAVAERQGKFELADGGTLFLDEVAEMPLAVQAKLLRVLQEGQLQRLGSDRERHVDVRLIAATNRDLAAEVRAGRLRADIYHRLSAFPLRVPPLRERGRDVLVLAGAFLEENRSRLGLGGVRLDPQAQAALLAYDWPGNVRELKHLVSRSILRALGRHQPRPRILTLHAQDLGLQEAGGDALRADAAPPPTQAAPPRFEAVGLRDATQALERRLIEESLQAHQGNWAAAARALKMDRANLARLAQRLGVQTPAGRRGARGPRGDEGTSGSPPARG